MSINNETDFPQEQPPPDPRPNGAPPGSSWPSADPAPAEPRFGVRNDDPLGGGPLPPPYGTPPPPPPPPPPTYPDSYGATTPLPRPYPGEQPGPAYAGSLSEPEPEPVPLPVASARRATSIRIGLWGSGRAGKSTFLAALPLAAMQRSEDGWVVAGANQAAAEHLGHAVHRLAVERHFPPPTQGRQPLGLSFHGSPRTSARDRVWPMFRAARAEAVDFALEDLPGNHFQAGRIQPEAIDSLASAAGLLYLIDPLHDPANDPSFTHFFTALQFLTARMAEMGQLRHGRLPHHVAVCVTKFDDERFFRRLVTETDLVTQDPHYPRLPRVPQQRAAEYFDWICDRVLGSGAAMVREGLRTYFAPDRIAYFATSAIGFRLNRNQIFDFRDFRNVEVVDRTPRLRDRPRPINVLEPLVFLERRIRAERQR